uniref:Uncharacterized protein n=1 Tax=Oryza meridionalis TaxID=40149 RepID=A0A0E0F8B0_9ORYZ
MDTIHYYICDDNFCYVTSTSRSSPEGDAFTGTADSNKLHNMGSTMVKLMGVKPIPPYRALTINNSIIP